MISPWKVLCLEAVQFECINLLQTQLSRGVLIKRCSGNMQQIYTGEQPCMQKERAILLMKSFLLSIYTKYADNKQK